MSAIKKPSGRRLGARSADLECPNSGCSQYRYAVSGYRASELRYHCATCSTRLREQRS